MTALWKIFMSLLFAVLVIEYANIWKDERSSRKMFAGICAAFISITVNGFILAFFAHYGLETMTIVLLTEVIILGIFLHVNHNFEVKKIFTGIKLSPYMILFMAVALKLLLAFPSTNIFGGRDDGLYFMQGIHIADAGMLEFEEDEYLNEHYEEISSWCELGYLGVYSQYNFGQSEHYGSYEFQFMPLFPIVLSIGYLLGGIPLMIRMNGIVGILSLLCFYCLIRDFIGNKFQGMLAGFLVLLSPAFLWNTRATFSEILTQFFCFIGAYLFAYGWKKEEKKYAILAGGAVTLGLFTRIDVYVQGAGILIAFLYVMCFVKKRLNYYIFYVVTYMAGGILAGIYGFFNNYAYFYVHWINGTLKNIIYLNVFLAFLAGVLYCFVRKKMMKGGDIDLILQDNFQNICILIYWIVVLYLLFVRRYFEGDSLNTRAIREFSWYTSMITVFLVPIGIKFMLKRCGENIYRVFPFLCMGLSNFVVYIIRPSISEDHFWASRRWVLLAIPFVMLCLASVIEYLCSIYKKDLAIIVVICVAGYLLYQDYPFIYRQMLKGVDNQYEKLAESLEDDVVYFTASPRLASTLKFVYAKQVYYLDTPHHLVNGKTENIEDNLVDYLKKSGDFIYYIGGSNELKNSALKFEKIINYQISGINMEKVKGEYPRKLENVSFDANVYKVMVE